MTQNPDSSRQMPPKRKQQPPMGGSPASAHRPVPPPPPYRPQRSRPMAAQPAMPPFPPEAVGLPPDDFDWDDGPSSASADDFDEAPVANRWVRLAGSWQLLSLGVLGLVGAVGIISAVSLFRIPNLPNCRAIFWLTASATTRIQCAEAYADQGTVDGYLEAIALVNQLPEDHPLRLDINQRIEEWAEQVLNLAESTFQSGQLQEAIAVAGRIPNHTAAAAVVNERIGTWKSIWEEAEAIYEAAEEDMRNVNFNAAFAKAVQLLDVGNTYWETTKYDELTALITTARADLNRLGDARRLAKRGTLAGFEEALAIVQAIETKSPVYGEAQSLLKELGRDMLELVDSSLDRRDAKVAYEVLQKIPPQAQLSNEISDYRTIIQAAELSWQGGVTGLEGAIVRLQSIGSDRPLYSKAQTLMGRWQQEVEGRAQLDWARQVAEPGTPADLQAAIAEAREVSRNNPMWDETAAQINSWQTQIETAEDQPILSQADLLAQNGDLKGAITVAQQIGAGRALSGEAQERIDRWTNQVQRSEDQPLLTQAEQLADAGNLQQAISVASQIGSGRVLYDDAQADIRQWRQQLQGQERLQTAYAIAQRGSVDALVQAVSAAQDVPDSSPQRSEANQVINRWSWDLLRLAETESQYNLSRAIEIASQIPPRTEAYAPAQLRMREWKSLQGQSMEELL